MKHRMSIFNTRLFYRIVALIFAILLFVYVNFGHLSSTRDANNTGTGTDGMLMSTKSVTLTTDLKVNLDSDKYFVSDYPEKVKVKITGPAAMVKTVQNTRNFDVYADLNDLGIGRHTVKLKTSGLNQELNVKVIPEEVTFNIRKRKSVTLPIQVRYDDDQIAKGYAVSKAYANTQVAQVTGAVSDVNRIDSIVADVALPSGLKDNYSRSVMLRALDANGKTLNVNIAPETARVTVQVYRATSTKEVNIKLVTSGQGIAGKQYDLTSATTKVTLHGTKAALQKIDVLEVPVSINGISHTVTQTVQLDPRKDGITTVEPGSISVKISVSDSGSDIVAATTSADKANSSTKDSGSSSVTEDTTTSGTSGSTSNDN